MNSSSFELDHGNLTRQLNEIDLNSLAKEKGFSKRRARKIGPALFLQSVVLLGASTYQSLRQRALVLGILSHQTISKQALFKRCGAPALEFLKAVLGALSGQIAGPISQRNDSALKCFARVLIQDSTTIALHPRLAGFFPGSAGLRTSKCASLKIQAIYQLHHSRFLHFELSSFRRNDQAASGLILDCCAPGDLIIRDLGYFVIKVFKAIAAKQAFFLSRLRRDCALYPMDSAQRINLLALLKKKPSLDVMVRLGSSEKFPVRLIAVALPAPIAAQRRRKARANRDRRLNPSKASLALLGWEIFITNVHSDQLTSKQIAELYGLRWRIETLFKAFKSHFGLASPPLHANKNALELFIYSKLIFITLFCYHAPFSPYSAYAGSLAPPSISLLKLAHSFAHLILPLGLFQSLSATPDPQTLLALQIKYHCPYDRRKRPHFLQCLQSLS